MHTVNITYSHFEVPIVAHYTQKQRIV